MKQEIITDSRPSSFGTNTAFHLTRFIFELSFNHGFIMSRTLVYSMRDYQDFSQYDGGCGSSNNSSFQRLGVSRSWRSNSVSAQEHTTHSNLALPQQVFLQEQSVVSEKSLGDRKTLDIGQDMDSIMVPSSGNEHIDDDTSSLCDNDTMCPLGPFIVESKGQRYRLMQLPDFIKLRNFAESQDDKWGIVHHDKNKKLLVELRPEELKPGEKGTGFNIVRTHIEWDDIHPETLFNCLHDANYRKVWDDKMIAGYNICQLDARNDIGYYAVKPHWMISKRDFCNMRSWMEFTNGEYIIMNHSVSHADCPEQKGFERAHSILTGYYMKPMPAGGTKLIFISHSDPKGYIPAWLVNNFVSSFTPTIMANLHDCALKYADWADRQYGLDIKPAWRTPKVVWDAASKENLNSP